MGVYIKGMEMPVFEHQSWDIRRGADGKWYMVDTNAETSDGEWHEIVPAPPHGRLIDADALSAKLNTMLSMVFGEGNTAFHFAYRSLGKVVENAPTIIPAEKGE